MSVSCFVPQLVGLFLLRNYPQPLSFLVAMGLMMFAIILVETYASNKTAELVVKFLKADIGGHVDELSYLGRPAKHHANEESFLKVHAPKTEQQVE